MNGLQKIAHCQLQYVLRQLKMKDIDVFLESAYIHTYTVAQSECIWFDCVLFMSMWREFLCDHPS